MTVLYFFFWQPQTTQNQPTGGSGATKRNRDRMKRRWAQIEAEDEFILEAIAKAFNE